MDPDPSIQTYIYFCIFSILSCAFFTSAETAMVNLNDSKLNDMNREGSAGAKRILKMVSQPTRFLNTIQIGIIFSQTSFGIFIASFLSQNYLSIIQEFITKSTGYQLYDLFIWLLVAIVTTFIIIFFGHSIPRKLGVIYSKPLAFMLSPILLIFWKLFYPITGVVNLLTNLVSKVFRITSTLVEEDSTEEEIRMLVDVGNENGVIEQSEKEMIESIFEFDELSVVDVMTHRTELLAFDRNENILNAIKKTMEKGCSRMPVYSDDIDNIIGILYIKDLLPMIECGKEQAEKSIVGDYLRPVQFVPESNSCADVFKIFQTNRIQIAVVVDEYGGTGGIVTMEDILEAIVGNIQDEYDNEIDEVIQLSDHVYSLDGSMSIDDVEKALDIYIEDDDDYDTLSGFIMDKIGKIPKETDFTYIEAFGVGFTVLGVKDRRIIRVKAEKLNIDITD